ncbi:MAG: hypothetical protein DSZ23_03695 [Thermodesulfatator sp.]|nr:MAG: hypothetical protein DSZ23_03695 [Thermodesulfatator sp.]
MFSAILSDMVLKFTAAAVASLLATAILAGCTPNFRKGLSDTVCGLDVKIISYHVKRHYKLIEELVSRLYAKNPVYEPDKQKRMAKINSIFNRGGVVYPQVENLLSYQLLTQAFSETPLVHDRVFLLGLGLKKGIDEGYATGGSVFLTGCQIDSGRLQRLYSNMVQANWRLKTYTDKNGRLLFITNEAGENGYINMGFEVIMTRMLTRIEDDIYLRSGLEKNLAFRLSTIFVSVI